MTAFVTILAGEYRGVTLNNVTFPLIAGFKVGKYVNFITVDGTKMFGAERSRIRINVKSESDFVIVAGEGFFDGGDHSPATQSGDAEDDAENDAIAMVATRVETDDEIMNRIATRFDILRQMSESVCSGNIRSMVISGPAGIGKSHTVFDALAENDATSPTRVKSDIIKGHVTPIALYQLLYNFRDAGDILVFDDADSVWFDEDSLNILKSALDSGKRRKISWHAESHALRREDIPNSFDYKGSIIFISNLKFDAIQSKKLQPHFEAMMSRCHYVDLKMDSGRDILLRIKQVVDAGELFNDYDISKVEQDAAVKFLFDNHHRFRKVDLRTVLKLADLICASRTGWRELAANTVFAK